MFDDFYGLKGRPFQLTPDPAFYFESLTHRKALSYLGYGLAQGEGFVVITGEVGAGKSTLVAHLMSTIDPARLTAAQVVTSRLDGEELVHVVAQAFGLLIDGHDKASALGAIESFFHEEARAGRRCLRRAADAVELPAWLASAAANPAAWPARVSRSAARSPRTGAIAPAGDRRASS
jgi:general secretion pathway protein A